MPFYISSCLFTSYVLYVCLRGLHMCYMTAFLCLCMRIKSTRRTTQCTNTHVIFWSFVQINLIIWRHTSTPYISINVIIFYLFFVERITHTLMSAVGSFILSLVCRPYECNIARNISRHISTLSHTHTHLAIWFAMNAPSMCFVRRTSQYSAQVQYHSKIYTFINICLAFWEMPKIKTAIA